MVDTARLCVRVLVIGASGFLGSYVYQSCLKRDGIKATGTSAHQHPDSALLMLDITKKIELEKSVVRIRPDCIVNCAAFSNVDECEKNPALAKAINATGAKHLADACKARNARLIHVSTDSVFDGTAGDYTEESRPNPLNAYAATKLEGEEFIASRIDNHVILRTNFYGLDPNGKSLLNWAFSNLTGEREMSGIADVIFNPLWVQDLAECILELASTPFQGIMNCAGDQTLSKYEFIKNVSLSLGYSDSKIKRAVLDDFAFTAARPRNTSLSNKKMKSLLKTKIHRIEDVLRDQSFDLYRKKGSKKI